MKADHPHILITNDDGIHAPGIHHLWKALSKIANISVVAPTIEQSASSLAITLRTPLRLESLKWQGDKTVWHVNGTPADCVKLALSVVLTSPPSLIVSGINRGSNAGRNILYSGTVAAVIEGVLHNIPGIAFSCTDYFEPDFETIEKYIPSIVEDVFHHPLPKGTFLNVNFPAKHLPIRGFKMARQGLAYWAEDPNKRNHPAEGHSYYWLGSKLTTFNEAPNSDISLLEQGYVTSVPIHIEELTHHQHLEERKVRFENIFNKF